MKEIFFGIMGFFLFIVIASNFNIPKGRNRYYKVNNNLKEISREEQKKLENGQTNSVVGFYLMIFILMIIFNAVFIGPSK